MEGDGGKNDIKSQIERGGQDEEKKQKIADMKNSILSQSLDQSARARLNTIALAKPEKAAVVENLIVNLAQSGQLQQRLTEGALIQLLEQVSEKKKAPTVNFDRRRMNFDDSDDEDE